MPPNTKDELRPLLTIFGTGMRARACDLRTGNNTTPRSTIIPYKLNASVDQSD